MGPERGLGWFLEPLGAVKGSDHQMRRQALVAPAVRGCVAVMEPAPEGAVPPASKVPQPRRRHVQSGRERIYADVVTRNGVPAHSSADGRVSGQRACRCRIDRRGPRLPALRDAHSGRHPWSSHASFSGSRYLGAPRCRIPATTAQRTSPRATDSLRSPGGFTFSGPRSGLLNDSARDNCIGDLITACIVQVSGEGDAIDRD